jgi:hypothetical protein
MTDMPPFTPRNVAKFVIKTTVQLKTASLVRTAIADRTSLETTDTPVVLTGSVVGWYVGHKVKPVTDKTVDKIADFAVAKRSKRQARKSEKHTETE